MNIDKNKWMLIYLFIDFLWRYMQFAVLQAIYYLQVNAPFILQVKYIFSSKQHQSSDYNELINFYLISFCFILCLLLQV